MNTYLCRPLVEHVPKMENAEITQCPIWGRDCWKRPELEADVQKVYDQVIETCTECAIRFGVKMEHRFRCCICKKTFSGYGHNPWPLKDKGQCCNSCNEDVILARLAYMIAEKEMKIK